MKKQNKPELTPGVLNFTKCSNLICKQWFVINNLIYNFTNPELTPADMINLWAAAPRLGRIELAKLGPRLTAGNARSVGPVRPIYLYIYIYI